jgi:hypothetical protein
LSREQLVTGRCAGKNFFWIFGLAKITVSAALNGTNCMNDGVFVKQRPDGCPLQTGLTMEMKDEKLVDFLARRENRNAFGAGASEIRALRAQRADRIELVQRIFYIFNTERISITSSFEEGNTLASAT